MNKFIRIPWITNFFNLFKNKRLEVGDRIKLCGGYENPPKWLNGKEVYYGEIVGFIPGPYRKDDTIVNLDEEISLGEIKGKVLILTLRFQDAIWGESEIVHLHLLDAIPQNNEWCNIDKNKWDKTHIESHATYRIMTKGTD